MEFTLFERFGLNSFIFNRIIERICFLHNVNTVTQQYHEYSVFRPRNYAIKHNFL